MSRERRRLGSCRLGRALQSRLSSRRTSLLPAFQAQRRTRLVSLELESPFACMYMYGCLKPASHLSMARFQSHYVNMK
jgi:hypothetical protein